MKPITQYTKCEFCDKQISLQKESYNIAEIHLCNCSSILLPDEIAKENNHSYSLDGYYCNPKCLVDMFKKILGKKGQKYLTSTN